jgi:hypothetical protein
MGFNEIVFNTLLLIANNSDIKNLCKAASLSALDKWTDWSSI